jgi:hypothetical protein
VVGALDLESFVQRVGVRFLVWPVIWFWTGVSGVTLLSGARVDPALNGYREISGEGKQEGCAKAQDGWPHTSHCTSWLKGLEAEISIIGLNFKGLAPYPLPFFPFFV